MHPIEDNNPTLSLPDLVKSDRLQLLYQQSYPAIFTSIFAAALLMLALWPAQSHHLLLSWFSFLLVTSVPRFFLFNRYHKTSPQGHEVLPWEKPYFITLMLSSLTWGIGVLMILPSDSIQHQVLIFGFLIAMAGGAAFYYSAHTTMTLATITVLLLPLTVYFLFNGGYVLVVITMAVIGFYISSIRATLFLGQTLQENFSMAHQLKHSTEEAILLARVDSLTGLSNRLAFYESGKVLINSCQRNNNEISIILMDIDNFKIINDTFGHASGDAVLKEIGKILLLRLRKSDIFARIGGEEFGMLLPNTSLEQATQLAEELRQEINQATFAMEKENFTVTASFGVTIGLYDVDALVRQADTLMYQSKESGRNLVTATR